MAAIKEASLLLLATVITQVVGRYGDPYPVSGSWFENRIDQTAEELTLKRFKAIGGDTVLLRGAEFINTTTEGIKNDPIFSECEDSDLPHCVDTAMRDMKDKGIQIQAWFTYTNEELYGEEFLACPGYDKEMNVAYMQYFRLILWLEEDREADDCNFTNGSRVAVLFSRYTGFGDSNYVTISEAEKKNMTVYLGLPKPPYIREDEESGSLIQAFFQFNYRIIADHKSRFGRYSSFKGYYSDVHLISDYIINEQKNRSTHDRLPPRFVLMFWRELYFLTGFFNYELLGSPSIDLTHASNTTLKGYMDGIASLSFFARLSKYVIRDGRGDGKAAYFREDERHSTIYGTDHSLYELLKYKNSSITEKTTFADVYYASIADFFKNYTGLKIPETWLMIEAYDDINNGTVCTPVDPHGSGMSRPVHSVYKHRLDQALTHVGSMVQKATAFAWDPLFICEKEGTPLADQIMSDYHRPIISECRFHSASNQSIVVIGFNLDGPQTQPFQVNYTLYDNTYRVTSLYGYYYELDYGKKHGLIDSLVYIQLYDIPDLRNLKRQGTISVGRTDGTGYPCVFNYTLNGNLSYSNEDIFGY